MPASSSPRLMLILPADAALAPAAVEALLRAGDVAAVIAQVSGGPDEHARLGALVGPVQAAGAAFLLEGRADLAATIEADGAHLADVPALRAALPALKPRRIAGVGGLATRHDAMEAGEAGADYVLFGDLSGDFERTLDAVDWWAEVFEVPCVGVAVSDAEAAALAGAGADFIALAGGLLSPDAIGRIDALIRTPERMP